MNSIKEVLMANNKCVTIAGDKFNKSNNIA